MKNEKHNCTFSSQVSYILVSRKLVTSNLNYSCLKGLAMNLVFRVLYAKTIFFLFALISMFKYEYCKPNIFYE